MNRPGTIHNGAHVGVPASSPRAGAPMPPGLPLRASGRDFWARLVPPNRGRTAAASQPSLIDRLRPPKTGWFRAAIGWHAKLSALQIEQARTVHAGRLGPAAGSVVPAEPAKLPDALVVLLQSVASRTPDQIFENLCGLCRDSQHGEDVRAAVQAWLGSQGPDDAILQLKQTLRAAHRWQFSSQASTRAQAAYAALVGSVLAHAPRPAGEPEIDPAQEVVELQKRLAALAGRARTPGDQSGRSDTLAAIAAEVSRLSALAGGPSGLDALAAGLRAELIRELQAHGTACEAICLNAGLGVAETAQECLNALRKAFELCPGWTETEQPTVSQWVDAAQDALITWKKGVDTISLYRGIQDHSPDSGMQRHPCKALAEHLSRCRVDEYRELQGRIDAICVKAAPEQHLELMAALGVGTTGSNGAFKEQLLRDLAAGERQAVDTILRAALWDDLAGALKLDGVAQREQQALSVPTDDPTRQKVVERFHRERFAAECQHQLRILNAEINFLCGHALLGDAGQMAGASEAAIAAVRDALQGEEQAADLLLLNWMYFSSLDPKTLEIDQGKAARLWAAFGKNREVPDFEQVRQLLGQGYRSLGDVTRASKMMQEIASRLPASRVLAAASQAHDPLVSARGILRDLHERVTGERGIEPGAPEFDRSVRKAVDHAKAGAASERQVLMRKIKERNELIDALTAAKWKFERAAQQADLPLTASQAAQIRTLVDCLGLIERSESALKDKDAASAAVLARELSQRLPGLAGFDAGRQCFDHASGAQPSYGTLKPLVKYKAQLEKLLNLSSNVETLRAQDLQGGPKARELAAVMEAVTRMAILQEAIATGPGFTTRPKEDDHAPAKAVLKRLSGMGLAIRDELPIVEQHVNAVLTKMTKEDRGLPNLCERFDPMGNRRKAKGFISAAIPGETSSSHDAHGAAARLKQYIEMEAAKVREDNRRAVEERFKALQPGESFELGIGQASELSGGYMIVPGVSVSIEKRGELLRGIRLARTSAGYEIDVVRIRSGGVAGVLSLLGDTLGARLGRTWQHSDGFRFSCASHAEALQLAEALAGGPGVDPTRLPSVKVQTLSARGSENGVQLNAQAGLKLGENVRLLSLEADVAASWGERVETARSAFLEHQLRSSQVKVLAQGRVAALNDKWTADAERGYEVSVSRGLTRHGGALVTPPVLSIRTRLIGGDIEAGLIRVMPHLAGKNAEVALAGYVMQIRGLQNADEAERTTEIELECVMTPRAVQELNGHYERARKVSGDSGKARRQLDEAQRIQHDPASYTFRALHVVLRSDAEKVEKRSNYYQRVARVHAEQRLTLPTFAERGQSMALSAGYEDLIGHKPAATLIPGVANGRGEPV